MKKNYEKKPGYKNKAKLNKSKVILWSVDTIFEKIWYWNKLFFLAAKRKQCGDVTCAMYCDHGFKVDENGCDICECNDAREL